MCTGYKDLRSLRCVFYFQNVKLDTLGRAEYFTFYHFIFHQDGIYFTKVYADISADITLNNTGNDILFFLIIFLKKYFSFLFTDFLKDYVLGIHGSDTSEFFGFDLYVYDITKLIFGVQLFCVFQADLHDRIFYFLYNRLFCVHVELTGYRINKYLYIVCFSKVVFTCLKQGLFDCFQKGILADVFFFLQYI